MTWEMFGHDWAVNLLSEHVAADRVRHAYLITGPQGVGRRTLALRLVQALNCQEPSAPGQPCGRCRNCTRILDMQHPDLFMVKAEQEGGALKVDQIRELQHSLSLAPYEARYRVALLLRFEEANTSAANALLKTLEEPSDQVKLILTADDAESLLPTIISRCEIIRLKPLPVDVVQAGLVSKWKIATEQAQLLAHLSAGRPGYAIKLHKQPELLEQRKALLEELLRLLSARRVDRFAYAERLAKEKDTARQALQIWLSFWRDVLLQSAGVATAIANIDLRETIDILSDTVGLSSARKVVVGIERTLRLIDHNVNTRLALEVFMLDLPVVAPLQLTNLDAG